MALDIRIRADVHSGLPAAHDAPIVFRRDALLLFVGIVAVACQKDETRPSDTGDRRRALVKRISRLGDVNDESTPRPLVTLEEFFEGNDDLGSIGYNFHPVQPRPAEFYAAFKEIRSRSNVADVRVEIMDHEDPAAWPATDTVWIITSESAPTISGWLGEKFAADKLVEGLSPLQRYEPLSIPAGMRPVGVWWD